MAQAPDPLIVPCPYCGARRWKPCRTRSSGVPREEPHKARVELVTPKSPRKASAPSLTDPELLLAFEREIYDGAFLLTPEQRKRARELFEQRERR